MKKLFIVSIIFLNITIGSAQDVDCSRINYIDGKYYIDGCENLFTGTCVSYYKNGIISFRASYTYGEIYGLCQWWYDNGQKKKEIKYVLFYGNSLADGNSYTWFPSGQLMIKEIFTFQYPHIISIQI